MKRPASTRVSESEQDIARIGWVVDVQNDFMDPSGRLYVHNLFDQADAGAINAVPAIERAVEWMHQEAAVVVYTGDWHSYGDREIDIEAPDPRAETYPPHCMGLSPDPAEQLGAALMPSIAPAGETIVLARDVLADEARLIARQAVLERRSVFVQKSEFSVFRGNEGADAFVHALVAHLERPVEFVVCGVATDVCVKHAVEGFLDRGYRVRVISDAMWGLGLLGPEETLARWAERGAALTSVRDLK